jgi:uncharacterized protein (TIGR00106 family)
VSKGACRTRPEGGFAFIRDGEWDAVFAAIKHCHESVHEMGAPRIITTIKLGTHTDREQTMEDKVRSVKEKMAATRSNG